SLLRPAFKSGDRQRRHDLQLRIRDHQCTTAEPIAALGWWLGLHGHEKVPRQIFHRFAKKCLLVAPRICAIFRVTETPMEVCMASFEQIEEYAERHTRALSDSHARLWKETHQKTDNPGMMVGPLEGATVEVAGPVNGSEASPGDRHVHGLQRAC